MTVPGSPNSDGRQQIGRYRGCHEEAGPFLRKDGIPSRYREGGAGLPAAGDGRLLSSAIARGGHRQRSKWGSRSGL